MADTVFAASPASNPGPLGLFAFGLTTCTLSAVNAGLLPPAMALIAPLAFSFGGTAQVIAGYVEFKNGNTFGATAFTSYGFFWWWFALVQWTVGSGWTKLPAGANAVTATILLLWGIFTFLLWIVTLRINKAVCLLFLILSLTFFLLSAGDFGHPTGKAGGYLGLATGLLAMLIGFAELLNTVARRTVVPLGTPLIQS